ncbi:MAG TPA: SMC-Scp complex subunit ScpB, partial [Sedimenticola sp.]|nr:SMC-Scp complex subunit ScpB [Sedimenticola sp.]
EREWIRVVGHRDVPGRPALYATTREFLNYFGLRSLDDLPTLQEIRDLDSINRELDLPAPGEAGDGVAGLPLGDEGDGGVPGPDETGNESGGTTGEVTGAGGETEAGPPDALAERAPEGEPGEKR